MSLRRATCSPSLTSDATKQSSLAPVRSHQSPFAPAGASGDTLRLQLRGGAPPEAEGVGWWGRKDSNLRSHKTADLQSAPFATRDTSPQQHRNPTAGTAEIRAIDDAETWDPSHGLPVGRVYGGSTTAKS